MSFKDILDECIVKDYITNMHKRKYEGIHLSELTGCPREYMLKVMGHQKPILSPEDLRVLDFGNLLHDYIQDTLIRNKQIKKKSAEYPVRSELYGLDSNADISEMYIDNILHLVDLKTIKSGKTGFDGLKDAKPGHKKQVTLYLYFINEERHSKGLPIIRHALVVYFRKDGGAWNLKVDNKMYNELDKKLQVDYPSNNYRIGSVHRSSDIKEFTVPYDEVAAKIWLKEVETLDKYIKEKYLPTREECVPNVDKFHCENFCAFGLSNGDYCSNHTGS